LKRFHALAVAATTAFIVSACSTNSNAGNTMVPLSGPSTTSASSNALSSVWRSTKGLNGKTYYFNVGLNADGSLKSVHSWYMSPYSAPASTQPWPSKVVAGGVLSPGPSVLYLDLPAANNPNPRSLPHNGMTPDCGGFVGGTCGTITMTNTKTGQTIIMYVWCNAGNCIIYDAKQA
jgi:hypothetical protein